MRLWKMTIFFVGISIGSSSSTWCMETSESDIEIVEHVADSLIDNSPRESSLCHQCCFELGFVGGKCIFCCNAKNLGSEECGECSRLTLAMIVVNSCTCASLAGFVDIASNLTMGELVVANSVMCSCCAVMTVCTGSIAGTYYCCDQCCGFRACPQGFRKGYSCASDHTCGPKGRASIEACCDKTATCFLTPCGILYRSSKEKLVYFWYKYIKPLGDSCRNKCHNAFDPERFK